MGGLAAEASAAWDMLIINVSGWREDALIQAVALAGMAAPQLHPNAAGEQPDSVAIGDQHLDGVFVRRQGAGRRTATKD